MPRPAKHPSNRRRRNRKSTARELPPGISYNGGGWYELPNGETVQGKEKAIAAYQGREIPPLPDTYAVSDGHNTVEREFLPATRDWYERLATDSVSQGWRLADFDSVRFILAPMFDRYVRGGSTDLADKLRLWYRELGNTPNAMNSLDWTLPDNAGPEDPPDPAQPSAGDGGDESGGGRRAQVLELVSDSA